MPAGWRGSRASCCRRWTISTARWRPPRPQEGDPDHHLTSGIRLVQKELLAALERVGIEPFSPEGERFDPHQHEAVSQVPADGAESGTIKQVYQQGYRYKEEILRPARVVVAE